MADLDLDGPEARLARCIADAPAGEATEAEGQLYRLLAPRARRYGLRHLRDEHAAADLMQHVLTLTIEQLRSGALREPARVVSFVLGACRMTVLEMRRSGQRRDALLGRYGDSLSIADIAEPPRLDHDRMADCLQRLPERERSVLVMSFYEDRSADDVADMLGLRPGNVRVIRHRGIAKLRTCLESGGRRS
ncbi:RNA polymerase sigma factor [Denitromonas iodatirespirans]|uniref:Sigma-70 family RNA polymerase sigma factor n=1 Tax=Denitromonas iodatirespirans TaxID=2795389 RepID=A0A944D776_DENI1|nr:sigma-70 family RNA polymerase sigma factor [Denitromonas iodatirespirans]MBT0961305.1 sigma-70 family RNA polymerase sigma factor [Denitromonas iodatirespirans]